MLLLEVPRLTTTLRRFSNNSTGIRDIDQAYVERKAILEKRRKRSSSTTLGTSELARRFIPNWDEATPYMRRTYEDFLSAVRELLGGELLSHELYEAAATVYDILNEESKEGSASNTSEKREELISVFGTLAAGVNLEKTILIAQKLRELELHTSDSSTNGTTELAPQTEFGADLEFINPSYQSIERLYENEPLDDWDLETGQPLFSLQTEEHYFGNNIPSERYGEADTSGMAMVGSGNEATKVDLKWFKSFCDHVAYLGDQFSGDELAITLLQVLDSDGTGDEIAGELFDIIGDADFEQIQKLLQHRKDLVDAARKGMENLKLQRGAGTQQPRMPSYGTQVSVQTNFDKQMEKLRRKEERKNQKRGSGVGSFAESDLEWLSGVGGFSALIKASEGFLDNLIGQGDESGTFSGTALPQGTARKVYKGYEEVRVPAAPTAPMGANERLVQISELDDFAQTAFQGYKSLNRIQSRIFQTAYHSNENLLVCAPTGAGKTNIAMITVLREIGQHFHYGILQKNEFKIVYVAPMKALAGEMTRAFSDRLGPLNIVVRELTGDMQLTKKELEETQMIITTPEKWDVITRKSNDMALAVLVKLLIIDEVHLLNDDRGPVIEALVARTLRQVESSQNMIRIVGLSATLPNYNEVARFLGVNPDTGLFFFDSRYRPVPLSQQYIGVTETNFLARNNLMNEICYNKVLDAVKRDKQAMVFVHSRKDTVKIAQVLVQIAQSNNELGHFSNEDHPQTGLFKKDVSKSRNRQLAELFSSGFGIHHAGMLRSDRNLTERMFSLGLLKVLVCTATLAWGVNLPAHTVVIRGTQLYDPKAGGWRELGMLDVMQIFGRAGRPQFDKSGEGIIITTHDKLAYYLRLLTHQLPIESQFISSLKDNLNAEVVLGTVTNLKEACTWLGYTYLFVRMSSNPLAYAMTWEDVLKDPSLTMRRKALITDAARDLDKAKMLRFDEKSGNFYVTDLGRVASHYYIQYTSVETYNNMLKNYMNESELIDLVAHSSEFENIMVREEEQQELEKLRHDACPLEVRGGIEDKIGKINVLIQVYISRASIDGFSLVADSAYISSSLGRIMRALFEICLRNGWISMTALLLEFCKAVDRQIWPFQHPLRQFEKELSPELLRKLEDRKIDINRLFEMEEKEIGALLRHPHGGKLISQCLASFPRVHLSANISPITRTVLQVVLTLTPDFFWKERWHGTSERWWILVEDSENEQIYHSEQLTMTKKSINEGTVTVTFTIPIREPLPPQYYIRVVSDRWLQAEAFHTVSFQHLILPEVHPPHTELLDLRPLPVTALGNEIYESMYKFTHFNPIQTQAFHILYHTDYNVLLGAPTGSGKTISAELAMLHLFNTQPDMKVIYIAPLKALAKERLENWSKGLCKVLGKQMVELTGDFTPDMKALLSTDIIISTPEKWDGISRNWNNRTYVKKVGLMIMDEIHLLGGDRGPILEVIVSRMRYISSQTDRHIRFVGLSTALANARDLANWLGINDIGLFNFKPSVRPVPLEVHIQGYPGKFYCPRMNSMNKPTYAAITTHSPVKPVLIFVSSRRQTRLTAMDLIQFAIADERPRQFLHMSEDDIEMVVARVLDSNLRHTLQFGIGLHHAGLKETDRTLVEELFTNNKIQVLVSTSTLAWGVNLPAHLVIIKGTEYYDGKLKRYVDFPITDVLQMMGRAGRPQYDQHGKAVILVHEPKKSFYKKFLYEPFPVESSLHKQLHDHFNAEITSGTIASTQDAVDYLTWTYLFRRLFMNPSYYDLETTTSEAINAYLSSIVMTTLQALEDAGCVRVEDNNVEPLMLGIIASQYYLCYKTVSLFSSNVQASSTMEELLVVLSGASEYDELPVRHNEEKLNAILAKEVRLPVDSRTLDDPHVKANLLLQAHFLQLELPISDYITDTKSVLDQSIRIIQALVDLAANRGWLKTAFNAMHILQMVMQGIWYEEDRLFCMVPYFDEKVINMLKEKQITTLVELLNRPFHNLSQILQHVLKGQELDSSLQILSRLPQVNINWKLSESRTDDSKLVVDISIRRTSKSNSSDARAFTPRYPKVKDESWWIVLGNESTWELHALKRISFVDSLKTRLVVPQDVGEVTLFLVSDCYIGLDQKHTIRKSGAK